MTRSGRPSPLRSPATTSWGRLLGTITVAKVAWGPKLGVGGLRAVVFSSTVTVKAEL